MFILIVWRGAENVMDNAFIQSRIDATKLQIVAYETAVDALATAGIQSYKIDTGQTVQTVTKLDLNALNKTIDSLYNRLATLEARLNGGTVVGVPAW